MNFIQATTLLCNSNHSFTGKHINKWNTKKKNTTALNKSLSATLNDFIYIKVSKTLLNIKHQLHLFALAVQ
jgi:hypothetical protein